MSKQINKHYRPVHASVQTLISHEYLIKNENGLIEPTFKNTLLLELGEKQRLETQTNKEIKVIINKISKLKTTFFSAILFGSSVYKKGKDIDILIIVPTVQDIETFKKDVKISLGSILSKIDLNIITEESCFEMLNKPNTLNVMNEIMKNHLVLYGHENFYNILKRYKNAW